MRGVCLLKLLTALPPDRVGVYRKLRLGSTLRALGDGSYQIDLSERGAHKTSAAFGPTRTTVTPAVAARVHALVEAEALGVGHYLFHLKSNRSAPLLPSVWTRFVQSTFRRWSGVPMSPKDCRSSFVSWLRAGEHGDGALKAAADAMHHSSKIAESAVYDKYGTDRVVAAAVHVADAFASQF